MIEKTITIEGVMRYEPEASNETAVLQDYRMAAITKDRKYTLIGALPYDFIVTNVFMRITEDFNGTLSLGSDSNVSKILADADFKKTVGKKSKGVSVQLDAGKSIDLYLGPGANGKIEVHVTGFLLMPSLL